MQTVLHRLAKWADENPNAPAQRYKVGNTWKTISVREYRDRIYHLALYLESKGFTPQDASCIFSTNCPEWVHFDLASLLLGAKSAGIYPNSIAKEALYVIAHTEAKLLVVQNKAFYEKIADSIPSTVKLTIVFGEPFGKGMVSYREALAEGEKLSRKAGATSFRQYLDRLDPQAGAILIYTSGTTGMPKGALLSQDNIVFTSDVVSKFWNLPYGSGDLFSFLPLCHVAEKLQNIGVGICQRYAVNFCTKFENAATELCEVEPTLLLSVPRLWEKMMEGVLNKIERAPKARKALAKWALAAGARNAQAKYSGKWPSATDAFQYPLAERLILKKIRKALGLSRIEALASGAAALPSQVSIWFRSIGLEILEDFGQTESTGVICMTERGKDNAGVVGKAPPGIEVRIAEDGEILARGRNIFVGYFKDEASTHEVLKDGWLHTGDLGKFTAEGTLKIKGRKKEILKTSGGKMVAPLAIEEMIKTAGIISQVCMVGDGKKYLSALITLNEMTLKQSLSQPGNVEGLVVTDPKILDQVKRHVEEVNQFLSNYEQVKKFAVLAREFSIEDGEMTPTLKMKRNVIEARFRSVIDSLYGTQVRE